jgi:hypothetical protein
MPFSVSGHDVNARLESLTCLQSRHKESANHVPFNELACKKCGAARLSTAAALQDHMADPSVNNLAARVGDFCLSTHAAQQLPFLLWLAAGWAVAALLQYASEDEDEETVDSSTLQ